MRFWGSSKLDEIGWCWMHIQAWIWWQGILLQSQFSLFLCILKPEAYAQKLDRSKTPAQLHIMNWHPDVLKTCWQVDFGHSWASQGCVYLCSTDMNLKKGTCWINKCLDASVAVVYLFFFVFVREVFDLYKVVNGLMIIKGFQYICVKSRFRAFHPDYNEIWQKRVRPQRKSTETWPMCATLKMDRVTGVAMDGEIEHIERDQKNACIFFWNCDVGHFMLILWQAYVEAPWVFISE